MRSDLVFDCIGLRIEVDCVIDLSTVGWHAVNVVFGVWFG